MQNDPMLSIYVLVYNHEKYIEQALNSILMQKTSYSYEVLVGEDCSQDRTRDILRDYEKKYPGKFKMFYRERNMNNDEIKNSADLRMRCKGKYIVCLEGDDYWTDPLKIQKQIDFLENNSQYLATSHNCIIVDEKSELTGEKYPECKDNEYSLKHFVSEIMPGQLTTIMYRNPELLDYFDKELVYKNLMPGDQLLFFTLASYGKIYCIQETMSAYRHITNGGSSFSANYKYDFQVMEEWHKQMLLFSKKIKKKESIKYAKLLYMKNVFIGIKLNKCSIKKGVKLLKKVGCGCSTFLLYLKWWINHHIFHKQIWV